MKLFSTKKTTIIRIVLEALIILFLIIVFPFEFRQLLDSLTKYIPLLNFIVLVLTLAVLVWYAYDTHRIAELSKETNLRPIILRSGYIKSFQEVKFEFNNNELVRGSPLEFIILKNIVTDITGYIIINGLKYKLIFGNDILKLNGKTFFAEKWSGWIKPETKLFAVYREDNKKSTEESDQIHLDYKDVEGNEYFTTEDYNRSQKAFKK